MFTVIFPGDLTVAYFSVVYLVFPLRVCNERYLTIYFCITGIGGKILGFSRGWKESFMSGEQEPWVVRGGLTADLQRLIPVDCGSDLFLYKPPVIPTSKIYTIRPYLEEDEEAVYSICRKTCLDGTDGTEVFAEYPRLPYERIIGGFCVLCPEFCFVIEDETGVVGYAVAALNAKQFYHKLEVSWIPEMREKYPLEATTDDSSGDLSPAQEIIKYFHNFKMDLLPENFQSQYPSVMSAALLNVVSDQSAAKRLVVCLLASLRSNGSFGVYVPLNPEDRYFMEFYGKLGFIEICRGLNSNMVYMARIF